MNRVSSPAWPAAFFLCRFALLILLSVVHFACEDDRLQQHPAAQSQASQTQVPPSLDEQLLLTLETRETWSIHGVKIFLANPNVSTFLTRSDGRKMAVHAWPTNSNDFHVGMMRIDHGELLYAITPEEFEELASRQTTHERGLPVAENEAN